jgi:glycosyltransferase involved in cell wall biosynthesis
MATAHALVCTSVREGWGLVVSEAAAVGTGTVAYDVPGLRDSVGATGGTLVAPTPEALGVALLPIAYDPASAPRPVATGTAPFSDVADALLAGAGLIADGSHA